MENERYEMRFAGSGGQGVILASVILAEAAVIAGLNTVQSQAYGPEARGGVSKAETIVSRGEIWYSKVTHPDFALPEGTSSFAVPILRTAKEVVGKAFTANIVAIGAINAALRLFDDECLLEAVRRHIPAGTEEINKKALDAGAALIAAEDGR